MAEGDLVQSSQLTTESIFNDGLKPPVEEELIKVFCDITCEKNTLVTDSSLDQEDESEICDIAMEFQYEAGPLSKKVCLKNPGHRKFIPIGDFSLSHLPLEYQDSNLLELVRQQAKLAVLLKVGGISEKRPEFMPGNPKQPYPFSGKDYRNKVRVGSGWVSTILKNTEKDHVDCPCDTCQKSGEPRKIWTKVRICTASHVVFDMIEAKNTKCYLFYDADDTDLASCPSLTNVVDLDCVPETDSSCISYAIHDMELADKLDSLCDEYKTLCWKIRNVFSINAVDESDSDLVEKMSCLYERCHHTMTLTGIIRDKLKDFLEGDIQQKWRACLEDHKKTSTEITVLGGFLYDKLNGGSVGQHALNNFIELYEICNLHLSGIEKLRIKYGSLKEDDTNEKERLRKIYLTMCDIPNVLDRELLSYKSNLNFSDLGSDNCPTVPLVYNSSHSLTIIVSHPHGCGKRVTIGKIVGTDLFTHHIKSYKYSNVTCPGSSGSRVFVLGRLGSFTDHAHSKGTGTKTTVQVNVSALYSDI